MKQEKEREGDEAGQVARTPDHGSLGGQESNWEVLKVEAGGGTPRGAAAGRMGERRGSWEVGRK